MADEFADDAMVHGFDWRGLFYSRRREKRGEFLQVAFVTDNRVRRGIAHRAKIGEIFCNRGFHDGRLAAGGDYNRAKASLTRHLPRSSPVLIQEALLPSRSRPCCRV